MKAHLLAISEPAAGTSFTDIEMRISFMHKEAAKRQLHIGAEVVELAVFGHLRRNFNYPTTTYYVDCETAVYDFELPPPKGRGKLQKSLQGGHFVPILFSPWSQTDVSDKLLLCFGALALAQGKGTIADTGTLIYGDGYRRRTVRIEPHVARARQILGAIEAQEWGRNPPQLVLNKHCAVCDFQPSCRALAVESDDLSLLATMTDKERTKCNSKGISTVTQLSYGYRPRRYRRTRTDDEQTRKSGGAANNSVKNVNKLKAVVIKKNQIHVFGAPTSKFIGTPTFIDVEGMPDRDFY